MPLVVTFNNHTPDDLQQINEFNTVVPNYLIYRTEHIILRSDYQIIGDLAYTTANSTVHIHLLAVHPDYQHQGHGTLLLNIAEQFFLTPDYHSIILKALPIRHSWYLKRGFSQIVSPRYLPFIAMQRLLPNTRLSTSAIRLSEKKGIA